MPNKTKKVKKKKSKLKKIQEKKYKIRIIFDAFEKKIQKKDYCTKIYKKRLSHKKNIGVDGTTYCVSMFYYSSRK